MMKRDVYGEEPELFHDQFRKFAAKEIEPKIEKWNRDGITDRETVAMTFAPRSCPSCPILATSIRGRRP
jgi:hypothetical protein